ncbi:MAG: hypothetical protein IBX56_08980, partial [Methylomicrobium sp.]|nr:hypothetical protein [Methylomicrobium sp.]
QGQVAPLNSIRSEQAQTGSSAADVQGWLPNRAKKLLDTGKLRVEQSAANVPQTAEAIDAGGIEGFYDRDTDTMYLIADQLTQENLPSVLAHESLHRAEATDPKLQASIGRFEQQLDNSFKHAAAGLGSDIEKAGFRRVMEANTEPAAQLEEYRAYLVSEYMRNPETLSGRVRKAIEDFIASIRVALIRSGLDMGFIRQLTPADLAAMSRYGMKVGSAKATSENAGTGMLPSASAMKSVEANVSRGRTAMTQALLNKATEHRAMFRTGMGWVDFVWGDEGKAADARGRRKGAKGLAHILEARQRKDGLTDAQAKNLLFNLVETIARGKEGEVYQQGNAQSMAITDGKHRVLLAKKSGSNAWMVTGYEIYPDGASSASDALAPTHSESTPSRNGMGAGNNKITDSKKSSTDKLKFSRASNSNDTRASALRKAGLVKDADNRTLLAKADDWRKDFKRQWDNVYKERLHEGMFDRLRGIYAAERDLLGGVTAEQSGYVSARLSTGSSSIIYGMLLKGAPKWDGSASRIEMAEGTKGLTDIFGRAGNDLDAFFAWMIGRRAERLMKEGRENNFTEAEIRELIAMGQGKEALFLSIRKEYNDFKKHVLDVAERGGLIDAEGRKSWDSGDYIPFYRALDKGGVKGPRNNRGFSHQTSGIKQLRGGTAALGDPLENIVKNFAHLIDASVKNNAIRKVADNFDGTGILEEIPRVEFTRALVPMAQFRKLLIEAEAEKIAQASGVDQAEAMQQAKAVIDLLPQDALEGFRQMAAVRPPSDPDVVRVMDGGKSHYYRVHDEALLRGLTALDQRQDNGFIRIMRGFKRVLTTGVTSDPTFMVRNFIRDAGHAWVINNDGFRLGIDSLRGAQKALSEKGGAIDMMFSGASFIGGYINGNDPEATAQAIRRVLAKQGLSRTESDSFMKTVTANSQALWERYRHVGDKIENASREAVYEAAIKAGKSKTQALFESKDLMDYSMQGNFMIIQFLGDVLPFFNARLQGLYKLGRTGVLTRHVAQRGLMVAGASIALLALNGDDERYEELEDWDKDMFWHVFLGGEHIRIPKPFEVGLLYGSVPERMMRNLLGKDDTKKSAQRLAWMILETFAMEPIPQAVKPLEEVIRNQDSFTNRPIE